MFYKGKDTSETNEHETIYRFFNKELGYRVFKGGSKRRFTQYQNREYKYIK